MPAPAKDACYFDLKRRILSTELSPGDDLDEVTLTARYGISRTPLREVFQRLAGEGYLTLAANRGAKVRALDLATLTAFLQIAPMIYATTARLAALAWTPFELAALKEAARQVARATVANDRTATALANHRFQAMIGQMGKNAYLTASLARLLIDETRVSLVAGIPATPSATGADTHSALIAAIETRDADAAVAAALARWEATRRSVETCLRPTPLPIEDARWAEEEPLNF